MSAQPLPINPQVEGGSRGRTPLRLLPAHRPVLSTFRFGVLIALLVACGLALVMVVSTSVAAQSRELAGLRREATELGYTAAALTTQLQVQSSTGRLALRAKELGMVPNPYPAFVRLSDGTIIGEPKRVTGSEPGYLDGLRATAASPAPDVDQLPPAQAPAAPAPAAEAGR